MRAEGPILVPLDGSELAEGDENRTFSAHLLLPPSPRASV